MTPYTGGVIATLTSAAGTTARGSRRQITSRPPPVAITLASMIISYATVAADDERQRQHDVAVDDVQLPHHAEPGDRQQRQQHEARRLQPDEPERDAGDGDHRQHVIEAAHDQPGHEEAPASGSARRRARELLDGRRLHQREEEDDDAAVQYASGLLQTSFAAVEARSTSTFSSFDEAREMIDVHVLEEVLVRLLHVETRPMTMPSG